MNTLQDLGQIGKITYIAKDGKERTTTVERSSGRHIGYKTRKGLLKNIKSSVNRLQSKANIKSVEILTVAMIATDTETISLSDLP